MKGIKLYNDGFVVKENGVVVFAEVYWIKEVDWTRFGKCWKSYERIFSASKLWKILEGTKCEKVIFAEDERLLAEIEAYGEEIVIESKGFRYGKTEHCVDGNTLRKFLEEHFEKAGAYDILPKILEAKKYIKEMTINGENKILTQEEMEEIKNY